MARLDRTNALHHVYRCYDANDRLAYVGSTADLWGRLATHRRSSWWSPQVVRVTAKVYPDGVIARIAERKAIADELPRWNKAGKWETRSRWTQDDWDDWLTTVMVQATWPTNEVYARIADYRRIWGCEPHEHVTKALAQLEAHREKAQAKRVVDEAIHAARRAEIEREDELALRRERKAKKARKAAKRAAEKRADA